MPNILQKLKNFAPFIANWCWNFVLKSKLIDVNLIFYVR